MLEMIHEEVTKKPDANKLKQKKDPNKKVIAPFLDFSPIRRILDKHKYGHWLCGS